MLRIRTGWLSHGRRGDHAFLYRGKSVCAIIPLMEQVTAQDALLIVDVQNDFLPGGALAVPAGDEVIPVISRLMHLPFGVVIATQDWHPPGHISFATSGGPWPEHCVAGTEGAELAGLLDTTAVSMILRKGRASEADSYSAFADNNGQNDTGLGAFLKAGGIRRVFITGLALDVCVAATALDALKQGFAAVVLPDACRAVGAAEDALTRMKDAGVQIMDSTALA